MQIKAVLSHLNGLEWLIVHRGPLRKEVQDIVKPINTKSDAAKKTKHGELLFSPKSLNKVFKEKLEEKMEIL